VNILRWRVMARPDGSGVLCIWDDASDGNKVNLVLRTVDGLKEFLRDMSAGADKLHANGGIFEKEYPERYDKASG